MCDRYFLLDKKLAIFQGTAMILTNTFGVQREKKVLKLRQFI